MATEGSQQSIKGTVTVSSGGGALTITNTWLNARWIRIKPIAETDSFDVTVADADGMIMFTRTGQIGTLSERLEMSLGIMRTVTIANATQDGTYTVKFDTH